MKDYKRKIIELVQSINDESILSHLYEILNLKNEFIKDSISLMKQEDFDVYLVRTFKIAVRFKKKKLLKRLYDLAVYLYLYEDGE